MERRLLYLNHLELEQIIPHRIATVVVPVGTVEAHGITPLGTDVIIPEAMALMVAERIDALVAPTVAYGITRGLLGHPGTLHIRPETFKAYMRDVLESLVRIGFKYIVVINGHGGQTDELKAVLFETSRNTGGRTMLIDWWYDTDEIRKRTLARESGHAGADETAAVMAINPDLIKRDLYREGMAMKYTKQFAAYPFPATIITYAEGDTSLNLDEDACKAYFEGVVDQVTTLITQTLTRWRTLSGSEPKMCTEA